MDVLLAVGLLRWRLDQSRIQVQRSLKRWGIHLSTGEISRLADEFLIRFHLWFQASRSKWASRLQRGLILLIDGTQDEGSQVTYRAVAYRQGVTVHAACLQSENEEDLVAFLAKVKQQIGVPRLLVRDFSTAARNACQRVFPGVPQQGCHWHFLRNAGGSLLAPAYQALRRAVLDSRHLARLERLRRDLDASGKGRRRALLVWVRLCIEEVLDARAKTGGFPFRLAYHDVVERAQDAVTNVPEVVRKAVAWNIHEPGLVEARQELEAFCEDKDVRAAFIRVGRLWGWFTEARSWFGFQEAHSGTPREPGERLDGEAVAGKVYGLLARAQRVGSSEKKDWRRFVSRFEEHRGELFPKVRLKGAPCTSAMIEARHREDRRGCRRRTGQSGTKREMQRVGEHLAVLSNLAQPWFQRHVLRGVDLVEVFQVQDAEAVKEGLQGLRWKAFRDRLPVRAQDRPGLLEEFLGLLRTDAPESALTAWTDRVEGVVGVA